MCFKALLSLTPLQHLGQKVLTAKPGSPDKAARSPAVWPGPQTDAFLSFMGGFHKVPSESTASRPQELELQRQLGGTTQIPRGKPRSSREKFTQLAVNMKYLYP